MPTESPATLDEAFVSALTAVEKIKAFLILRDGSIARWAKRRGFWPQHVYNTFEGDRAGDSVWDAVAEEIGISRAALDAALQAERTAASA